MLVLDAKVPLCHRRDHFSAPKNNCLVRGKDQRPDHEVQLQYREALSGDCVFVESCARRENRGLSFLRDVVLSRAHILLTVYSESKNVASGVDRYCISPSSCSFLHSGWTLPPEVSLLTEEPSCKLILQHPSRPGSGSLLLLPVANVPTQSINSVKFPFSSVSSFSLANRLNQSLCWPSTA